MVMSVSGRTVYLRLTVLLVCKVSFTTDRSWGSRVGPDLSFEPRLSVLEVLETHDVLFYSFSSLYNHVGKERLEGGVDLFCVSVRLTTVKVACR